jgi:hypothetical protein
MPPIYPTNTTLAAVAVTTPTPSPNLPAQNALGTSLPASSIAGIVVGIGFLFCGLAWFAHFALVVLLVRKNALLKERKREREGERWGRV